MDKKMGNRKLTLIRRYGWLFTFLVGLGGLWYHRLGLLVIPVMVSLITVAFFRGRFWCGNFCPHGSLYDVVLGPLSRNRKLPAIFKSKLFAIAFFVFFGFNLIRKIGQAAQYWGELVFWDQLGFVFVASYLMVIIVGGLLAVLIRPRTWCNFCPMGVMQVLSYKLGKALKFSLKTDQKITITNEDACRQCGLCAKKCPMELEPYLNFNEQGQFDNEACIRCENCVYACPIKLLTLSDLDLDQKMPN